MATAVLACSCVLAACGAGGDDTRSGSAGPTGATGGRALAEQSPQELLATTAGAVEKIHSYRLQGTYEDEDGRSTGSADVADDGAMRAHLTIAGGAVDLIITKGGSEAYVRGARGFWEHSGAGAVAELLADRWVKMPRGGDSDITELVDQQDPRTLARCLRTDEHGRLTNRGLQTHRGRKVVVLEDDGTVPGSTPNRMYIAATGRPLPLLITESGPERPGGRIDERCGDDPHDTTKWSRTVVSRFDEPVRVTAPSNALDLDALERSAGGGSAS
jgi:hypothetical protein